jgi:hypothetical protein
LREGSRDKERGIVAVVDENLFSDDNDEVCIAEWVDTPKGKPMMCSFLKPRPRKRDEMKFTFDVSKCNKLFDVLLHNNIIKLKGGTYPRSNNWRGKSIASGMIRFLT